jgi:broad specificity phosphatase PhoE
LDRAKHTAALTLGELARVMPRLNGGRAVSVASSVAAAETAEAADGDDACASWPFSDWPRSVPDTPELRELAKGPRQGFPKHMSLDQSKERRRQLAMTEPFPLLETEEDGWKRMSRWLDHQIRAAIDETVATTTTMKTTAAAATTFHVLAFGHSGIFRVFLTRLVGMQVLSTHPDVTLDNQGRFSVPNASLTILDIHLDPSDPVVVVDGEKPENRIRKVDVVVLTSTEHYLVQPQPPQTILTG